MDKSTVPYALAVDDDQFILMDITGILTDAGFRCHEASDGDAAWELIRQDDSGIVLLFTDVEMPGSMNGFQLAQRVAKSYPEIEIVVASGRLKPEPGDMPEGATFLGKPFSAQLVHSHLRDMLPDGKKPEPLKKAV